MKGAEFEAAAEHYADHIYAIAYNYFKNPYKINKKIIYGISTYMVITLLVFAISFKPYLTADNQSYNEYIACGNTYDWFN